MIIDTNYHRVVCMLSLHKLSINFDPEEPASTFRICRMRPAVLKALCESWSSFTVLWVLFCCFMNILTHTDYTMNMQGSAWIGIHCEASCEASQSMHSSYRANNYRYCHSNTKMRLLPYCDYRTGLTSVLLPFFFQWVWFSVILIEPHRMVPGSQLSITQV